MKAWLTMILLSTVLTGLGQSADLLVSGLIYGNNGLPMRDVSVVLTKESDRKMDEVVTGPNGKFELKLSFDELYTVFYNKPGYGQKSMVFDTQNVPDSERQYAYEYGGFRVTLFEEDAGGKPKEIARIHYDPGVGNFVHFEE